MGPGQAGLHGPERNLEHLGDGLQVPAVEEAQDEDFLLGGGQAAELEQGGVKPAGEALDQIPGRKGQGIQIGQGRPGPGSLGGGNPAFGTLLHRRHNPAFPENGPFRRTDFFAARHRWPFQVRY